MLMCDFGNLEREIRSLEEAGVEVLHLDVMDGQFVKNFTYGLTIVETCRRLSDLVLDVHLMIESPDDQVARFAEAGADLLTVHIEALEPHHPTNTGVARLAESAGGCGSGDSSFDSKPIASKPEASKPEASKPEASKPEASKPEASKPTECLTAISKAGCGVGLALNPGTPLERVEPYLHLCDLLLVMSVNPGFGGQSFQTVALEKLRQVRALCGDRVILAADGGVNQKTIPSCVSAGAEVLVIGSAIFQAQDYQAAIREFTALASMGS